MTRNWIDGHTSLTFSSSALSPNLATMFILYGIVGGIGCGLMFLPTGTTCNYWFKKRRAIANGKYYHKSLFCGLRLTQDIHRLDKLFFRDWPKLEGQNVRNFTYLVRIRWSRQPNLVPFYLCNRIFECPENIRNDGFPDVRWPSSQSFIWLIAISGISYSGSCAGGIVLSPIMNYLVQNYGWKVTALAASGNINFQTLQVKGMTPYLLSVSILF